MSNLDNAITRMRGAASTALKRSRKVTGQQMDEDLMIYERLQPKDFETLEQRYGKDSVIRYIKTMAARKVDQNAN